MEKIIRVNLNEGIITSETVMEKYRLLGGRALTSRIISDEVDPNCEPLGRHNKLVFAPGLFGGSYLSSSSRLSVGAKSPLTGGIKEANAGGTAAGALSRLGVKALIFEGLNRKSNSQYLYIDHETIELRPAEEMAGHGVYSAARLLRERYGTKTALILTGPAGERGYSAAGITNTDPQGRPSRFCGRGGLGAVMGIKGLKAVVIKADEAPASHYHDRKAFQELNRDLVKIIKENPTTGESLPKYGTAAMATRTNALQALPTRNFSSGSFEEANRIDGEYLHKVITARGGAGETTHACMAGCVIKCSNVYADSEGLEVVAPIEYETIGLMGSNLGIGNLDDIARLNYMCNDLGLDTIETGATIGVAMDRGLVPFGDAGGAANLLAEIAEDTILGKVLGHGTLITGKVLGSSRIPVVKGQALAAYDPRSIKGLGVTYSTSPMGADHTAGNTIRAEINHSDPAVQVEVSRNAQIVAMVADSMGLCVFLMPALGPHLERLGELYGYYRGHQFSAAELRAAAAEALEVECAFNRCAGLSPAQDRLPEFMLEEPLPLTGNVFDVPLEELQSINKKR